MLWRQARPGSMRTTPPSMQCCWPGRVGRPEVKIWEALLLLQLQQLCTAEWAGAPPARGGQESSQGCELLPPHRLPTTLPSRPQRWASLPTAQPRAPSCTLSTQTSFACLLVHVYTRRGTRPHSCLGTHTRRLTPPPFLPDGA